MRVAVRTRLGSLLFPLGEEGRKEESEGSPNVRRGVYAAHCGVIAWRGRGVVQIVLLGRSGCSSPRDRSRERLVRHASRRPKIDRIGSGREGMARLSLGLAIGNAEPWKTLRRVGICGREAPSYTKVVRLAPNELQM